MKKYTFIVIFSFLFFSDAFSQKVSFKEKNSFYKGKRGLIEIGVNPRISRIDTYNSEFFYTDYDLWRLKTNLFLEYTYGITNNWSATLNVGRNIHFRKPIAFRVLKENSFANQYYIGEIEDLKEIKSNRVGLRANYHLKNKGSISPMGHYFGFGVNYLMNSMDYNNEPLSKFRVTDGVKEAVEQYQMSKPINFNLWSLDLTYGARKNIAENLFVSWHMLWSVNNFLYWSINDFNVYNEGIGKYISDVNDIKRSDLVDGSINSMKSTNIFSFRFGVGYVLH
jgi:hypothetical protein